MERLLAEFQQRKQCAKDDLDAVIEQQNQAIPGERERLEYHWSQRSADEIVQALQERINSSVQVLEALATVVFPGDLWMVGLNVNFVQDF